MSLASCCMLQLAAGWFIFLEAVATGSIAVTRQLGSGGHRPVTGFLLVLFHQVLGVNVIAAGQAAVS